VNAVSHSPTYAVLIATLAAAVSLPGCAAVGLTLFGVGAGVAAGTGTGYTLDGIAYRTFSASVDEMRRATLSSLKRMDIAVKNDEAVKSDGEAPAKREILAEAADRKIYIELEQLTKRTTRMRVTAKQGFFFRDRATAGEIIAQTEHALDELPASSQKVK